jgi:hypothetical protein
VISTSAKLHIAPYSLKAESANETIYPIYVVRVGVLAKICLILNRIALSLTINSCQWGLEGKRLRWITGGRK